MKKYRYRMLVTVGLMDLRSRMKIYFRWIAAETTFFSRAVTTMPNDRYIIGSCPSRPSLRSY